MLTGSFDTSLGSFHLALHLTAEAGKTTVLLGESGSGKTTVLRLLAGLLQPAQGHVTLDGVTYFDSGRHISIPPQERPFGYVFQDYVLFPHLTVFENVAFGLRAQRLPRRLIVQRVGEALEKVHLSGLDQRRPAQLSGGQQQRVAIARALVLQPQLLLLDEPLSALDVQTRREVRQELRRILSQLGITTVMVTHQYLEALLFGHQIVVLEAGSILQQGNQRDLLEHPRSSYIAELVGTNFFRGFLTRRESQAICTVRVQDDGKQAIEIKATLEERQPSSNQGPREGEEVYMVVDPRSITLSLAASDSSASNVFRGEIVQILRMESAANGTMPFHDGRVRVSVMPETTTLPLIAEITEASTARLELQEGKLIYAAFKATEARAYN
ncbi:MAG: ATP-binding cassette domain-containing protein [Chloroflexi bacterium]|nr:ATP-binding cassette domain-containing protein [Ktedonobacteraceae bacterium]MBV9019500.1 ATP-binding cassette domain-containing protein [Ktedonobacteraceae bacterium]MBV9706519.1 ATP-binding cassette domain-containing protein [Chloroflexota bacterium]